MGWFSKKAQIIEHTMVKVGEEEIEKIAKRTAELVLEEILHRLDPDARVVKERG